MSVFTNPAARSAADAGAYVEAVLGLLGEQDPLAVLRDTGDRLEAACRDQPPARLRAREAPGKWSVAQVLRHLADSELVWGWRLRMVLAQDRPAITGYDQDLWAERLGYRDADPEESLELFRVLRRAHLVLLDRATREDLVRAGIHAERGEETVAHMIRLYAGHDILHLNQVDRILRAIPA